MNEQKHERQDDTEGEDEDEWANEQMDDDWLK